MAPTAQEKSTTFIRFTGAGNRVISEEDWQGVDVGKQAATAWNAKNAHRLPKADFSVKALNYLLKVDGDFVEEDFDGNAGGEETKE